MKKIFVEFVPGLLGGVVGGVAGYFVFKWLLGYSLFAPVVPGALCGLGCGLLSRTDSSVRGILCAVQAAASGLLAYWLAMRPPLILTGRFSTSPSKRPVCRYRHSCSSPSASAWVSGGVERAV